MIAAWKMNVGEKNVQNWKWGVECLCSNWKIHLREARNLRRDDKLLTGRSRENIEPLRRGEDLLQTDRLLGRAGVASSIVTSTPG